MTHGLEGTETARPFLPAKYFALSRSFYESLALKSCSTAMSSSSASVQAVLSFKTILTKVSQGTS